MSVVFNQDILNYVKNRLTLTILSILVHSTIGKNTHCDFIKNVSVQPFIENELILKKLTRSGNFNID